MARLEILESASAWREVNLVFCTREDGSLVGEIELLIKLQDKWCGVRFFIKLWETFWDNRLKCSWEDFLWEKENEGFDWCTRKFLFVIYPSVKIIMLTKHYSYSITKVKNFWNWKKLSFWLKKVAARRMFKLEWHKCHFFFKLNILVQVGAEIPSMMSQNLEVL